MKPDSPEQFFDSAEASRIEEEVQTFNLESKDGLHAFQTYLTEMRAEATALAADLDIASLDYPEDGKYLLRTFRINYTDLLAKLSEVIEKEGVASDVDIDTIENLYQDFADAQTAFIEYQEQNFVEDEESADVLVSAEQANLTVLSPVEEVESGAELAEDLAIYKTEVLDYVNENVHTYFSLENDAQHKNFQQQVLAATTPQEVSNIFSSLSERELSGAVENVEPTVLPNPEAGNIAPAESVEDFTQYKEMITNELAAFLKQQRHKGTNERLAKSIDEATTKAEVDNIRHNILHDPAWQEKVIVQSEPLTEGGSSLGQFMEHGGTADVLPSEVVLSETSESLPTLEEQSALTQTAAENLATKTEQVYTSLTQKFPRGRRTQEVIEQINRLQRVNQVAEDMLVKIAELKNSHEDEPIKLQNLRSYEKIARKAQAGLQEWLSSESLSLSESATVSEVSPLVLSLPTEVEVASYTKRLKNPFYGAQERQTAMMLLQYYHEAVATEKSAEAIQVAFKSFADYVQELDTHPSPQNLAERIARIEERLDLIKSSEPELVTSIQTMKEQFEQAANLPEPDEDRMLSRYKLIEKMALDTEHLWFTVCGMHLPKVGPAGVFGARSFREGLVLVRDRHADLVGHPEKQKLVDEIIGKLWRVPDEGISNKLLAEITQLAHQIDASSSVVGNFVRPETEPVEVESAASEVIEDEITNIVTEAAGEVGEGSLNDVEDTESAESGIPSEEMFESTEEVKFSSDLASSRRGKLPIDDDGAGGVIPIRNVSTETAMEMDTADIDDVDQDQATFAQSFNAGIIAPTLSSEARRNEKGILSKYASAEQLRLIREIDNDSSDNIETDLNKEIQSEINRIERKGERLGWFSSMVNEPTESVFSSLKEMKVIEVAELFSNFTAANRDELLKKYKISYDNLSAWKDEFDDLQKLVVDRFKINPETLTFGQLVVQANIARMINLESGS